MAGTAPKRRRGLRIAAVVLTAGLALAGMLPLALRGPLGRWIFARATASLCGSFALGGGHLGPFAVFELLLGRPIHFVLDDVRIAGPDGRVVFAAAHLEARLTWHRLSSAVVIEDGVMARGQWRLALHPDALDSADAFRAVPDAGRPACLDPHAVRAARPPGGPSGSIAVRGLELQDVDVDLDFPTWGLTLARVNAAGTLGAGGSGPPLLFDVRDAIAAGGRLRIGVTAEAWTAEVPFDAVAIARVAVAPEAPTDLRLEVAGARTGRARLSGLAVFKNIFPPHVGQAPAEPPGLELDARWSALASALAATDAAWLPRGTWAKHLDGDLTVRAGGPFVDLSATIEARGGGSELRAHLGRGAADLSIVAASADTSWMLDPALRPLLGGRLQGHLQARARLAPSFAGIDAEIVEADLRLDRRHAPSGPRRFELHVGGPRPAGAATDTLYGAIGGLHLRDATLTLDDLRLDWTGLSARARAAIAFPGSPEAPGAATGAAKPRSHVELRGRFKVAALEDWIPGGVATGPLGLDVNADGTLERIDLSLGFLPPSTVGVLGQRFRLPRRLELAMLAGSGIEMPRFKLARLGGGDAELGGRIAAGGGLTAFARLQRYPIAGWPGLDRVMPAGALTGAIDAELSLTGTLERPALAGRLAIPALGYRGSPIGAASAKLRLGPDSGQADLTVDPGVTVHARVRRRPALAIDAEIAIQDRALGPWLPAPLAGAPIAASGEARLSYRDDGPLVGDGTFRLTGPGLEHVELDGHARGVDAEARLRGRIELGRWRALWSPFAQSASGVVDADVTVSPGPSRARLSGRLLLASDLSLREPRWPASISVAAGGRLDVADQTWSTPGLSLRTAGVSARVSGHAMLDSARPERSTLALALAGELDAADLPVRLPAGATARGRVALDAHVNGPLGGVPGPEIDGRLRFEDLTVQPADRALPAVRARGAVEARGDTLRADSVRLDVAGVGTITVGRPAEPARAELLSLSPLRLGHLDLPFFGQHLTIGGSGSSLAVRDLDADVRLSGDARGELKVDGDVVIAGGSYDSSRAPSKPKSRGPEVPWYRVLPPHLTLDLRLRGPHQAVRVAVPVLPDVTVDFQCRLIATNRGAKITGGVRGDSAYSRAALGLYDWLASKDLRQCQIGTP